VRHSQRRVHNYVLTRLGLHPKELRAAVLLCDQRGYVRLEKSGARSP
jgi:hypothetical protein